MSKDAELDSLRSEASQIENQIEDLQCALDELEEQIRVRGIELVCAVLGVEGPGELTLGHHECKGSPTDECCYDVGVDPYEDSCLFCCHPRERK